MIIHYVPSSKTWTETISWPWKIHSSRSPLDTAINLAMNYHLIFSRYSFVHPFNSNLINTMLPFYPMRMQCRLATNFQKSAYTISLPDAVCYDCKRKQDWANIFFPGRPAFLNAVFLGKVWVFLMLVFFFLIMKQIYDWEVFFFLNLSLRKGKRQHL